MRFLNDVLLSAPSILIGLFVYELLVAPLPRLLRLRRRRGAGAARRAGDHPHHRGRAALQPTRCANRAWRSARRSGIVIRTILWRAAASGILTGALLAFARISGETAPLLFTALNNQFFSWNMGKPMANLPVVIFNYALTPYDDLQRLAWAGALLIAGAVLGVTIIARILSREQKRVMNDPQTAPDEPSTSRSPRIDKSRRSSSTSRTSTSSTARPTR